MILLKGKICYVNCKNVKYLTTPLSDTLDEWGGFTYTEMSGYYYGGWLSKTIYKTKGKAMAACSANSKCTVSMDIRCGMVNGGLVV